LCRKAQEKPKAISVSGDGLRTCPTLLHETLGEESLNEAWEVWMGIHD
jgi:hypothetical protein